MAFYAKVASAIPMTGASNTFQSSKHTISRNLRNPIPTFKAPCECPSSSQSLSLKLSSAEVRSNMPTDIRSFFGGKGAQTPAASQELKSSNDTVCY